MALWCMVHDADACEHKGFVWVMHDLLLLVEHWKMVQNGLIRRGITQQNLMSAAGYVQAGLYVPDEIHGQS